MKVLLLEDDLALSDILKDYLIHKKFNVTLCNDGQEALEYLVEEVFDFLYLGLKY